jgi:hypothetical protein
MLAVITLAAAVLIGLGCYTIIGSPDAKRGAAGPLYQSSPRSDPPPLMIRPDKTS